MQESMYVCVYVCVNKSVYVCMSVFLCVCVCEKMCICACECVHVPVCVCFCICVAYVCVSGSVVKESVLVAHPCVHIQRPEQCRTLRVFCHSLI